MATSATTTGTTNPLSNAASSFTPTSGAITGKSETLSEWAGPYVTDLLGKVKAMSAEPYQVYGGPLTAGASELQQKYFQGLGQMGFPSQLGKTFSAEGAPTLPTMTATGMTGGATQPTGIAAQYMNPYLSAVLSPQLSELQRQAQIAQMNTGSKLTQAGAFGGGRQAIMDAETQRNLLRQMNETIGTGYATAYDKAMGQFNTEQGQAKGLAELLGRAGGEQRGIEAEGVAADKAEFEAQRDFPYKMLQFEQSMLQGLPIQSVAAAYQQPSTATNVLNTAGGLMDLYERFFKGQTPTSPITTPK
jgi:hypothetical protein